MNKILFLLFISTILHAENKYISNIKVDNSLSFEKKYYDVQDSIYLKDLDRDKYKIDYKLNIKADILTDTKVESKITYQDNNHKKDFYINTFSIENSNFSLSKNIFMLGNSLVYRPLDNIFNYSTYDDYGIWNISYTQYHSFGSSKYFFIPKIDSNNDDLYVQKNNMFGYVNNSILNNFEINNLLFYSDGYDYNQKFSKHFILASYGNMQINSTDIILYYDLLLKKYSNFLNARSLVGISKNLPKDFILNFETYYNHINVKIDEDSNKEDYELSNNKNFSIAYSIFKESLLPKLDFTFFNDYNFYKKILKTGLTLEYQFNPMTFSLELINTYARNNEMFDKSNVYKNSINIKLQYDF